MKSVFEEATSVVKAIEKGWIKAGQPHKFSVAILEKPEKNFIGMVKKPAKIGIFFEDRPEPAEPRRYQPQRDQRRPQSRAQSPQQHDRRGYQPQRGRPQQQPPKGRPSSPPVEGSQLTPDRALHSERQPQQPQENRTSDKKERRYPRIQTPRKAAEQYRPYELNRESQEMKPSRDNEKGAPVDHKKPENK